MYCHLQNVINDVSQLLITENHCQRFINNVAAASGHHAGSSSLNLQIRLNQALFRSDYGLSWALSQAWAKTGPH